jgi:hypothetical protein
MHLNVACVATQTHLGRILLQSKEWFMHLHCSRQICRVVRTSMLVAAFSLAWTNAGAVLAATFTAVNNDGHVVSATADFTVSGDVLTVRLTNTTPTTNKVQDLLTGVEFELQGFSPTLSSITGVTRSINSDGTFSDGVSSQDLSWSLKSLGGDLWGLDSHPDAEHSIIGPATNGNYASASRSIRGNPGHNPFAAEMAIATLNVPGLGSATGPVVVVTGFGFSGSDANATIVPGGGAEIPEPATTALAGIMACMCYMLARRR